LSKQLLNSLTKNDFDIDWFSGTGAGGQHRNKHQNCVRITHKESGLKTSCQNHRDRKSNFRVAFEEMGRKLKDHYHPDIPKERAPYTEVVRTYNIPDNRVTDHASGHKESYSQMEMDIFIEKRLTVSE